VQLFTVASLLAILAACGRPRTATRPAPPPVRPLQPVRYAVAASLRSGETLGQLLARLGVEAGRVALWVGRAAEHLDPRQLPVGLPVLAECRWGAGIEAVRLVFPRHEVVVWEQGEEVRARKNPRPVREVLASREAVIRSSLFAAVDAMGEGDELAVGVAEVFAWQVDFHRDLQPGDRLEVLFLRLECEGERLGYGPILAARLTNRGTTYQAFRFATASGVGYFDERGRPLKRQFLRSPLPYTRVSSGFSASRLHPVLGRRLPHFGVDYAAPLGTPVRATADGVVSFVGFKGGGGNTVELRHAGGYSTAYLHLSRFAPGIKVGARVTQGQVIGFVGATGLATGPHLDYRVMQHGRYLNPARIGADPLPPLTGGELEAFKKLRAELAALFAQKRDALDPRSLPFLAAVYGPAR